MKKSLINQFISMRTLFFVTILFSIFNFASNLKITNASQIYSRTLITDPDTILYPEPKIPKPDYLKPIIDPIFNTKVIRITGDAGQGVLNGYWGEIARHHYSKDQPWNADQSLLIIDRNSSSPNPIYLDGNSYEPLFSRRSPGEDRWHPLEPNLRIYVSGNEIGIWNVRNGNKDIIYRFSDYSDLKLGPYEGNVSRDGRWIAPLAKKSDGNIVTFAFDMVNKIKYPDINLNNINIDWVSISALGNYIVVNGIINGRADNTQVYNLQGSQVGSTWSEYGRPSHYDLTVDQNGDEVAVGVSKSFPDEGRVIKRRLKDGKVTILTKGGYASHTSARNYNRPGWVYVSYQYRGDNWPPYKDEIVVVKLDGSMQVERLVHMHTILNGYSTEAHAVPSPDGKRVIWASNWDNATGQVNSYVVDFRSMIPLTSPKFPQNSYISK